jgi:hypothetical protein
VLLLLLSTAGCYQAWPLVGPYQCNLGSCPEGLTCDDGLCCRPGGLPACRTLVLDGGVCASGGVPKTYYEDLDGDGYGNAKAPKLLCSKPVVEPFVDNNLDCDDMSAEANPKGTEKCDGLDNNCDGTRDEGLTPVKTYFRDEDGDGYGDATMSVSACAAPPGYVESNNDCDPNSFTVHPGAPELCNGLDDDCNGSKDDNPTDVGADCTSTGKGECAPGKVGCVAGAKSCVSVKTPKPDICDGLDNNCNGTTDEQPDCGGPASLNAAMVVGGARDLNRSLSQAELTAGCLRDTAGATGESWSSPKWTGSGGSDHVLFFEPASGTWDLSKPGLKLQLNMSWTMVGANNPAWAASSQPVVSVCAAGSFNRYVHGGTGTLLTGAGGNFAESIPIAGGNSWVLGFGSGADLTKVQRIEVLIRPASNAPAPSFTFTVLGPSGFVP